MEHRDGTQEFTLAPVRTSIYSLPVLRELLGAATDRYLDFLAAIENPRPGLRALEKIATPVHEDERRYRGFTLFHGPHLDLFRTILRPHVAALSGAQLSRLLKRLRTHRLLLGIHLPGFRLTGGASPGDSASRSNAFFPPSGSLKCGSLLGEQVGFTGGFSPPDGTRARMLRPLSG